MGCFKAFKFWRRRDVEADLQGRIEEFQKQLEERDANQKQLEATFRGRLAEVEEQNIEKEQLVTTLRSRVTEIEEKLGERDREKDEAIKELEKKLQEKGAEKEQLETALLGKNKELKNKDRDMLTLEIKLRLRIRELRLQLQETDDDKKEAESTLRDQREYYKRKLQESEAISQRTEEALNDMIFRLQTQLLERERELNISRTETRFEKERAIRRIKGLENTVRQKDRDRKTMEDNFHRLIKEHNEKKKVESSLCGRMKKLVAVAVVMVAVVVSFINYGANHE